MAEPKIRFKRDDGSSYPDLIDKKLGDIGTVLMCKRVFREQTDSIGDVPFYKIGTFGGVPDAFISRELYEELKTKYSFPKKGNVLLSAAGTIGRTVRYDGEDAFFQDSNIVWLDHDDSVLDDYLYYFYQQASWKNLEGGTIQRLYNGILLDKEISIPCLEEQHKIADFLSSVDDVITTSEKEVANLETQKKAVMKKIFSQEVRFKRDDGSDFPEWEEKRLGDIASFITKGTTPQEYVEDSNIRFVRIDSIQNGSINGNKCLRIDEKTHEKALARSILQEDDILCSIAGALGVIAIVPKELLPANTNQALAIIRLPIKENKRYIAHFLSSFVMEKFIRESRTVGAQPNLSLAQINDITIAYPCLEEQRLIADFLSDFDEAIVAAKKELELWKELKKGLLQQMFV